MRNYFKNQVPLILVGIFSTIGLFLWYKDYSYFSWGEVEPIAAMAEERYEPCSGEDIAALYNSEFAVRPDVIEALVWFSLESHMQLKTTNNSDSSLFVSVYDYTDYKHPVLKEPLIEILPGDHWAYDTKGDSYMLVVYGKAGPEEFSFSATNADYMYLYKNVVKYVLLGLILLLFVQFIFSMNPQMRKYLKIFNLAAGGIGTVATMYMANNPIWEDFVINSIQFCSVVLAGYAFAISWMDSKCAGNDCTVNRGSENRYGFLAAAVAAIAVSFLFFSRTMNSREGSFLNSLSWMNKGNVKAYAIMLILLVVIFMFLMLFLKNKFYNKKEIIFDHYTLYSVLLIFCASISRFVFYGNERKIHNKFLWLFIFAVVFLFIYKSIFFVLKKQGQGSILTKGKYIGNAFCFCVYGIVIIASSLKQTIINCWGMGFADVYHAHWYFSSVSYVVNGKAFLGGWIDKYGHYGLWYKPIMDIFGNTSLVMGVIFGIANAVTVSIFLYMIHKMSDNLVIRLCGAVALGVSSIVAWLYPMTLNGRLFVVAITLFLIKKTCDCIDKGCSMKKIFGIEITGVIVGIFNIISSTDVGIISNIVWALTASLFMVYVVEKNKTEIKISRKIITTIKSIVIHFLLFALQISIAYVVIKVWNYCHADIPIHKILEYADEFDFGSEAAGQNNKFIFQNGIWIYILISFMIVFVWKLKNLFSYYTDKKGKLDIKSVFVFSLSLISLGMFVFYVSRPEDFLCVGDLFIINICLLADQVVVLSGRNESRKNMTIENLIGTVIMTGCVFVFTVGAFNVGNAVKNEYDYIVKYHQLDWQRLTEEFEEFKKEVPENTYIEDNLGLSLIYMNIGRKMPDRIENCDYILCCGSAEDFDVNTEYIKAVFLDTIEYDLYRIVR